MATWTTMYGSGLPVVAARAELSLKWKDIQDGPDDQLPLFLIPPSGHSQHLPECRQKTGAGQAGQDQEGLVPSSDIEANIRKLGI